MTSTASMPVTRVCSSTSTSRTPKPFPPSGARSSKAVRPRFCARCRGSACPPRRADGNGARASNGNGRRGAVAEAAPAVEPPAPAAAPAVPLEQPVVAAPDPELLGGVAAAMALVKAYRMHGHLAAELDPLGSAPVGDPALDPFRLEPTLTAELQARIPASFLRVHVDGETLAEALPHLKETYCGSMAYEIEHISDHEQRVWLRKAIESWRFRRPLEADEQRRLYRRLCEVESLERYLRRAFLGQKQFSLEGLDVLIPMLDESLELAAAAGAREVVLGMAHRGRLNVLAHTIGVAYEKILLEFEGEKTIDVARRGRRGRHRRREVPPRRERHPHHHGRRDRGHARRESEPPRSGQPGRRRPHPRRANRSQLAERLARPDPRDAGAPPRRSSPPTVRRLSE